MSALFCELWLCGKDRLELLPMLQLLLGQSETNVRLGIFEWEGGINTDWQALADSKFF